MICPCYRVTRRERNTAINATDVLRCYGVTQSHLRDDIDRPAVPLFGFRRATEAEDDSCMLPSQRNTAINANRRATVLPNFIFEMTPVVPLLRHLIFRGPSRLPSHLSDMCC